jgi:hypothetical protein
MAKRFTFSEAQSLIPQAERLLTDAVTLKPEYEQAVGAVQALNDRVSTMGGTVVNREPFVEAKKRREGLSKRLRDTIQELLDMGCVIKDLDIGLIDFPTLFRGEEVYLCFKLGESAIEFWHGEEGFRGRKPIDQDFLDHHKGDRPQ